MRISDWSSDVCSSDLALADDHARTRSWQALPRVRRTVWRPDRAGGDARVDEAFRARSGVEGLDLFPDRQSRLGEPRPRLRGPDLSCDGHSRGRGPDARRALAEGAALRRSRRHHHLWLVLWRLYDAETDRKGAAGILRGGDRGRIDRKSTPAELQSLMRR